MSRNDIIGDFGLKFKSILIIFNFALIFFMVALVFVPYSMSPAPFTGFYWTFTWPFLLILALFFLGFNLFYIRNRRLFVLLQKEDWPALTRYLENRVIKKGSYSPRLVRLLANTYLLLSDAAAVMSLENKAAVANPKIIDANALIFGTARILGGDIPGAARFFASRKETAKGALKDWISWYCAFTLLLNRQYEAAGKEFTFLTTVSEDKIISGLSCYFLAENIAYLLPESKRELTETAFKGRERLQKTLSIKDWNTQTHRLASEIHVAAIAKYLDETGRWLYR